MASFIRTLMVLSLALLLVGVLVPFRSPLRVDIPMNQPPVWLLGGFLLLVGLVAGATAMAGLMRFRRWGRRLAVAASVVTGVAAWLLAQSPLPDQMSGLGIALLAAGASAWLCGLAMSYHPRMASRFKA